jgi:UDP-N-acetyl-2-amino-2-deoxyglucuronate dehydrogenase
MLRVGVVGVGGMGQAHAATLPKVEGAAFTAVCDTRPEATQAAAEKFGVKGFTEVEPFLDAVDAIVVATPPDFHRPVVEAAARAGKHVFCEKPLSTTLADADAMIAACDAAGVVLQTGMVLRFYPVHELARQMVDDGVIGDLVYLEGDYTSNYRANRERPTSWYGTLGGLLENGIHKVDLLNWFGGEAQSVTAEVGSWSGHEDWEDYAVALIRYNGGSGATRPAVGTMRWGPFMGARGNNGTFLDGTGGSLRLDIGQDTVYRKLLGEREWTAVEPADKGGDGVMKELAGFVASATSGAPCRVDGRDGRRAVELCLAVYQAGRTGTKVTLPLRG